MTIDLDEEIIDAETDRMYKDFVEKMKMQGVSEELYLAYAQTTKEKLMEEMKTEAEKRINYRYLLEAIVKEEKIEVSDKEAKAELKNMTEKYHVTEEEIMKELGSLEVVKYDMRMKKAIDVLKENN